MTERGAGGRFAGGGGDDVPLDHVRVLHQVLDGAGRNQDRAHPFELADGMSILGVDIAYQPLIKGAVLLAAVAFDAHSKRRAPGRCGQGFMVEACCDRARCSFSLASNVSRQSSRSSMPWFLASSVDSSTGNPKVS